MNTYAKDLVERNLAGEAEKSEKIKKHHEEQTKVV